MQTSRSGRARSCAVLLLSGVAAGVVGLQDLPVGATDADVMVVQGTMNVVGETVALSSSSYSFPTGGCLTATVPSPVGTTVAAFVDVPRDESGACTGLSGGGSVTTVDCAPAGEMSANWQVTEPSGDPVSFVGSGVVLGSVALIAGAPSSVTPGDGYFDKDGGPGRGVAVALLEPRLDSCPTSTSNPWSIIASVVGAY